MQAWILLLLLVDIGSALGKSMWTPVIGILAKPVYDDLPAHTRELHQFIDGAYVHFLEAGGAKVAYINYNASEGEIRQLFTKLNGALFPGGAAALLEGGGLSKYGKTGKLIMDLAIEANAKGDNFPVWGTCLGFELMILVASGTNSILKSGCNCTHYNARLDFSERAQFSRLFSQYPANELYSLAVNPLTYNNHKIYVTTKTFYANRNLRELFDVLATSRSKDGKLVYIAAIEGKKYPFYAVQFHPEKNSYVFDTRRSIDHSRATIRIMQEMSAMFVEEARKSGHRFASLEEEAKNLVYQAAVMMDPEVGAYYWFP